MSYKPQNVYADLANSKDAYSKSGTYPPDGNTCNNGPYAWNNDIQAAGQQYYAESSDLNYYRFRTWMNFNLPSHYMSLDAILHIQMYIKNGSQSCVFQVRQSTAGVPPAAGDFGDYGSVIGSVTDPPDNSDQAFTIPASYLSSVVKLMLTTDRDVNEVEPTDLEYYQIYGDNDDYKPYLIIQVPKESKAPTNISVAPLSGGTHILAMGTYHAAGTNGNTKCTYIRVQISYTSDFSSILKDTGQVAVSPIDDGGTISRIIDWFPSSEKVYYVRIATWDDDNHTLSEVWGDGSFIVSYPSINSIDHTHNKENYTFTAEVQDSYTKPPAVSLVIDGRGYIMELLGRSGTYIYTYQITVQLERGKHRYHVEVGNVWTVLIGSTLNLHANYKLSDKGVKIFAGKRQINAWNITLDLSLLPDVPTVNFDTDEELGSGHITVVVKNVGLYEYAMDIAGSSSNGATNHIKAVSTIKHYLKQTISMDVKSSDSYTLMQNILGQYPMLDDYSDILQEPIILWDIKNETRASIIEKVLILNNACAYEQNGHIIVKPNTSTNAKYQIGKHDAGVKYGADFQHVYNRIREYYKLTYYPVPATLLTNYDAANWAGTAENIQQTTNGLAAPSGNLYLLKLTDAANRVVDFKITDYDFLKASWCPEGGTSLEMRLKTDDSNYYKYTKTFAGKKGAGFVLTGANSATDELSKTISASIHISSLTVYTGADVSAKVTLLKSGTTVYESPYLDTIDQKASFSFPNFDIDTIVLTFTNLAIIGTSYGVRVNQLAIQKYYQVYEITSVKKEVQYQHKFDGYHSFGPKATLHNSGMEECHINKKRSLGMIPPPSAGQTLTIEGSAQIHYHYAGYYGEDHGSGDTSLPATFYRDANNNLVAEIDTILYPSNYWYETVYYVNKILIHANVKIEKTTTYGQYVWKYSVYPWQETYNLFETFQIPFDKFIAVGTPTEQINSIELVATGIQNFDKIHVKNNLPHVYYLELKTDDWTEANDKFQERKLDDMNSYENAKAFTKGLLAILKNPIISYEKDMSMGTDINLGDFFNCDGQFLHVYRVSISAGKMHIQIGHRTIQNTINYLKETHKKLGVLEKNIM